ncbi:MAG: pyridoxamine 5'-phosphate oxidase family protein [Chloroflexi bacterium]|nr:pyridoxamine 5'-phosphate oxidase family protein [Chloroflexota bacterium]
MTGEEREFLKANRLVVVGLNRKAGPPHLTPVYYVLDGDDLLMSTTASRLKARAVRRNPDVSLCVIGEQPPFPYLLIYGKGTIEQEGAVDAMMQVGARMTGNPVPESARPALEERARSEGRVVLRVRPESIRGSLPRNG